MNDFKVGDEVYEIHPYAIKKTKITFLASHDTGGFYGLEYDPTYIRKQEIYKSKNEAIDALIKYLEEMKNK